jgi:hypothetical protein
MSSAERKHKTKEVKDSKESTEEVDDREEEVDCEEETDDAEEDDAEDEGCAIDLSQNEIYRGICTLLEDEQGNNILEYISLLHTELIGINKSMENLRGIRKDLTRLADVAELLLKGKGTPTQSVPSSGASVVSSATSHHEKSERSKKSTKV